MSLCNFFTIILLPFTVIISQIKSIYVRFTKATVETSDIIYSSSHWVCMSLLYSRTENHRVRMESGEFYRAFSSRSYHSDCIFLFPLLAVHFRFGQHGGVRSREQAEGGNPNPQEGFFFIAVIILVWPIGDRSTRWRELNGIRNAFILRKDHLRKVMLPKCFVLW